MAELAVALARRGCRVTYIVESEMSDARRKFGWVVPALDGVRVRLLSSPLEIADIVEDADPESIHLCQGLRSNGRVREAQAALAKRGLQQWALMETVDDTGWKGMIKRVVYAAICQHRRASLRGVFASGAKTPGWLLARGMPQEKIFPFTYFLRDASDFDESDDVRGDVFQIAFVGKFIDLKRFPLLVNALRLHLDREFELTVIGSGEREQAWKVYADQHLPGRIRWMGKLPSPRVQSVLRNMDCLVLPSSHDGWGAVVSEALMVGTPAICSDSCGAAEAVLASGVGGVFPNGDTAALAQMLGDAMGLGMVSDARRHKLAEWARCLGADAGANYLMEVLDYMDGRASRPTPPWNKARCA